MSNVTNPDRTGYALMTATVEDASKPRLWREPRAWLQRKIKLKLNDWFWSFGVRVTERVEMTALQSEITARHIIDVGVSYGTPDLYERFPDARLELFEPSTQFHQDIERRILARRSGRLHPVAASDSNGTADLHLSGPASSSLLGTQTKPDRTFSTEKVETRRLDGVFTGDDLLRPCLLKIDTEGHELAVLRGAEGILSHIDYVILELHMRKPYAYRPHQVIDHLAQFDFRLVDVLDHEVRRGYVVCVDFVFARLPAAGDKDQRADEKH